MAVKSKAAKVRVMVDGALVRKASRALGTDEPGATIAEALKEAIKRSEQMKIVELFGKVDFDPGYDYKAARRKR